METKRKNKTKKQEGGEKKSRHREEKKTMITQHKGFHKKKKDKVREKLKTEKY